jgi:hypothetical protein
MRSVFRVFPADFLRLIRPIVPRHITVLFQVFIRFATGEVLHTHRSRKSSKNPVADDGSRCDAVGVHFYVRVISSQMERWRPVRVIFRTYEHIAQGRSYGLRSPSCEFSIARTCVLRRGWMHLESSRLISRRSISRPTESPSGALPGPTSSSMYGPVQQRASLGTNANDLRAGPSVGAFETYLLSPLMVLSSS